MIPSTKNKKRGTLLWIGDAACATGFAVVTHEILNRLKDDYHIAVIGLNYYGDPHTYEYAIYPARPNEAYDQVGIQRLKEVYPIVKPDVVCIVNDPWVIKEYLPYLESVNAKVILYTLADGKHLKQTVVNPLNTATHVIAYTKFAEQELREAGLTIPTSVQHHGVDVDFFRPMPKAKARQELGIPQDWYIVGALNRNQPRKRLDLTIQYFAEWAREKPENVKFYFHGALNDIGYDIDDLMQYYGVGERLIVTSRTLTANKGAPRAILPILYNCFDVQVSTTQGEGFGLTTAEGMACGVPQIVPDWSALGEWCRSADGTANVEYVPCTSTAHTADRINAVGGIADKALFVEALEKLYVDTMYRTRLGEMGRKRVCHKDFNWRLAALHFSNTIQAILNPPVRFTPQRLG